jgi:transposase-like protein
MFAGAKQIMQFGKVEQMMMVRGVLVHLRGDRQWCRKSGQIFSKGCVGLQLGDQWYLDEVFIKVYRKTHYLWQVVERNGECSKPFWSLPSATPRPPPGSSTSFW